MNKIKKTAMAIGKVTLVLAGGVVFPVLIWVALVIAMNQKLKVRKAGQAPALPGQAPAGAAPATGRTASPTHCWEVLHCPQEKRGICPAYVHSELPCWGIGADRSRPLTEECVEGMLVNLGRPPVRVRPKISHS